MVHSNICPEAIFINSTGCWKIAGFEFCIPNANVQSQAVSLPINAHSLKKFFFVIFVTVLILL